MKLYIKEKVFSWSDRFTIKDEYGEDRYTAQGELISIGKKLHVYDRFGEEVITIRQKVVSLLPRYDITIRGREFGRLVKKITLLRHKYVLEGVGWEIEGNIYGLNFTATQQGRQVFSIAKEWISWGDSYAIDIPDPALELQALAVVLAIDCANEAGEKASIGVDIADIFD